MNKKNASKTAKENSLPLNATTIIEVSIFNSRALNQNEIEELLRANSIEYSVDENNECVFSLPANCPLLRVPKEHLRPINEKEIPRLTAQLKSGQLQRITLKAVELEDKTQVLCIVDGMHRIKVLGMLDRLVKAQTNQKANLMQSMLANLGVVKQDISQVYKAIAMLVSQGMSFTEVTQATGIDSDKAEQYYKLSLLNPEFRETVLKGNVSFMVGKEIATAIDSGKFTADQINQLYMRAKGEYNDLTYGVLPPASVENIKSAKKSILAKNKTDLQATSEGKIRPDFTHTPKRNEKRLEETISLYMTAKGKEEVQGFEGLDEKEANLVEVFDYIFEMRDEDIQSAYASYKATYKIE